MWSSIDREVTIVKDQAQNNRNISSLREIISGVQEMLFPNGPGLLTDIHRQAKTLYPTSFTGINLIVNKNIGDQAKYALNLNLDPTQSDHYTPFNSYIGRETRRYSDQTTYAGCSTITFEQDVSKECKFSMLGHVQHIKNGTLELVLDYYGKNFTSSLSMANSDAIATEGSIHHLHEINQKLTVGGEFALKVSNSGVVESKRFTLSGRYYENNIDGVVSATVGLEGLQLCLYKRINSKTKFGSAIDVCFQNRDVKGSVAVELTDKEYTLRSSLDSKGCLVANLLKNHFYREGDIVFKPSISLLANVQMQVKLGIGFELLA